MKFLILFLLTTELFAFDQMHSKFSMVLKKYTKKDTNQVLVNYKDLKANQEEFNSYIKELESLSLDEFNQFSKEEKLAFWINAYNAFTIQLILKNYPIKSIKDAGSFISGPWSKDFIHLLGKVYDLDNIEHDIIRKEFKEPRIHFAVNCASMGCPSLYQEAFVAKNLNKQLEIASKNFILNKKKNYYDKKENILYLSKIFNWYGADFNSKYQGYRNYIKSYINLPKNYAIEWLDYDWKLNSYND